MKDGDLDQLLRWGLPRLGLRWEGFRNLRRQVLRRMQRRLASLGLGDAAQYRRYLEEHPEEWAVFDALCRVTITRFYRDRPTWDRLVAELLPALAADAVAAGRPALRAWSAGCAGGEEPHTLAIVWRAALAPRWPAVALDVLATDIDDVELARARHACYPSGAMRDLPAPWRAAAFAQQGEEQCLRPEWQGAVRFARHDVREPPPGTDFDLIFCRNLAFTYFGEPLQRAVAGALHAALRPGGLFVIGAKESLPDGIAGLAPLADGLYRATEE